MLQPAIATGTPYEVQALKDLLRGTRSVIAIVFNNLAKTLLIYSAHLH